MLIAQLLQKDEFSLIIYGHCWRSQLKAPWRRLWNKALVRSTRPLSPINAILYLLSAYNFWSPLFFWVALFSWAWHLCTKFSFAKRILSHRFVNVTTYLIKTFNLPDFFIFFEHICLSIRLAKCIPSHSCVGSAIRFESSQSSKTSTRPKTSGFTSPEILRYYVVKTPFVLKAIGTKLK